MSDSLLSRSIMSYDWRQAMPVFRYSIGITLIFAFSAGSGHTLAYITPVLALNFFAPGVPPLSFKAGLGFVISLASSCFLAFYFGRVFLGYPLVYLALLGLVLFHVYYSGTISPLFRVWLIIALLLIPFLSTYSYKLGSLVSVGIVANAILAILLVWFVFMIFPFSKARASVASAKPQVKPTPRQRFITALNITIVIFPVVILFNIFQWSNSVLVLIFVGILSLKPQAANFKAGTFMILANIGGGIAAILAFNLFVVVPDFLFLILITLLIALFFGSRVYSDKPTASLYGTAFSTYLLVLGSVITSESEAAEKVWDRIIQIGIAVIYVVVASRVIHQFIRSKSKHDK